MPDISVTEIDCIYLSYDEPNAEENWSDLLSKVPWAKRVHGVKGFDAAHKACAELSDTDRFITVDGDNRIDPEFMDVIIPEEDCVLSWAARNSINGLVYGNGGLKVWTKDIALSMKTHESSEDERLDVEFCWNIPYRQMPECFSTSHVDASPFQAYRAGFREGVKMCLDQGMRVPEQDFRKRIVRQNMDRLSIWCSVGSDVENGEWAVFGALDGANSVMFDGGFDIKNIRDYEWFDGRFKRLVSELWPTNRYGMILEDRGNDLAENLDRIGISTCFLDPRASAFFKSVHRTNRGS